MELPAWSVAVLLAVRAVPSPVIVLLAGLVVPDNVSVAVQATATSPLYQPAAFGFMVGLPDSVGATLSMLMPLMVVLAVLSALSVTVPVTDWLAALVLRVVGAEEVLTPGVGSPGAKETVTSVLSQPFVFAAGVREPVIVGAVLSSLTVTGALVAVVPALSRTGGVFVAGASRVRRAVAGGARLTPEPPVSAPVQLRVTSPCSNRHCSGQG